MFEASDRPAAGAVPGLRSVGLLVADEWLRERLQALLQALPSWRVAFAAATCAQARRGLALHSPALLLVDLALPGGAALELLREAGRWWPDCVAVAFCGDALAADAQAPHRLLRTLAELAGTPTGTLAVALTRRAAPPQPTQEPLTPREAQVLWHVAQGSRYHEAACALGVTVNTVRHHIRAIYGKLGVNSRSRAAIEATRLGLLQPYAMA